MDYVMVEKTFLIEGVSCVPADLLEEMLSVIHNNLPENKISHELIFRSKYILTELITNALKHSNSNKAEVHLELSENKVRFVKTDDGSKFNISKKLDKFNAGYLIAKDIMHTLYAIDKQDRLFFYCHENNEP